MDCTSQNLKIAVNATSIKKDLRQTCKQNFSYIAIAGSLKHVFLVISGWKGKMCEVQTEQEWKLKHLWNDKFS